MKYRNSIFLSSVSIVGLLAPLFTAAAEAPEQVSDQQAQNHFNREIVLEQDDVRAFPDAPEGFDSVSTDVPHGTITLFEYDSDVTGTRRKANVYTPPEYDPEQAYPVLYLLHGIGGDETEWMRFAKPEVILDNLIAEGKAVPMIVVMPNGRALPNDRAEGNPFTPENAAGFAKFEYDLLDHLIPAIEAAFPTLSDRENRGLAGLSMGGGQTLNFGLGHLDTFAWIGAFSSAPNTRKPIELVPDPAVTRSQLKLLYLSVGNKDGLINFSQELHRYLVTNDVPHYWNVDDHGHDAAEWANNFYYFSQFLFRP